MVIIYPMEFSNPGRDSMFAGGWWGRVEINNTDTQRAFRVVDKNPLGDVSAYENGRWGWRTLPSAIQGWLAELPLDENEQAEMWEEMLVNYTEMKNALPD